MSSTTIVIPGREDQIINGMVLDIATVKASFAGEIDLSGFTATENRNGDDVTITFANRTGTKGAEVNITINGDVTIKGTRIEVPGRETMEIADVVMTPSDVRAALAGDFDLSGMEVAEEVVEEYHTISFSNRTGTKGSTNILEAVLAAAKASGVITESDVEEVNEALTEVMEEMVEQAEEVVTGTRIVIPGREDQFVEDIIMDADTVRNAFAGEVDLSGYTVAESDDDGIHEVRFAARTGTKG